MIEKKVKIEAEGDLRQVGVGEQDAVFGVSLFVPLVLMVLVHG